MTGRQAAMALPAGVIRDYANRFINLTPTEFNDLRLEFASKAGTGAVLTVVTNTAASALYRKLGLKGGDIPPFINGGMILAAFTVNGAIIAGDQLKNKLPPEFRKSSAGWAVTTAIDGATVGAGVLGAILPAAVLQEASDRAGAALKAGKLQNIVKALDPSERALMEKVTTRATQQLLEKAAKSAGLKGWSKACLQMLIYPFVQVVASAVISNIKLPNLGDKSGARYQAAATQISDTVAGLISTMALTGGGLLTRFRDAAPMAGWLSTAGDASDVTLTAMQLIGKPVHNIQEAKEALDMIDRLQNSPWTHISNPNPALSYDEAVYSRDQAQEGLQMMRKQIYQDYPALIKPGH